MISDMQNILCLWSIRGLSLLGKIQIFNTLGVSKIVYVSSVTHALKYTAFYINCRLRLKWSEECG